VQPDSESRFGSRYVSHPPYGIAPIVPGIIPPRHVTLGYVLRVTWAPRVRSSAAGHNSAETQNVRYEGKNHDSRLPDPNRERLRNPESGSVFF
jgi:hypothetical protein